MKINKPLGITLALLLVAGGIFLITKSGKVETANEIVPLSENDEEQNNGNENGAQKSMRELVATNEPMRCTFAHVTEAADSSGEVFVADGKIRGNFKVKTSNETGTTFDAYMITDGKDSYVWSSVLPQGYKVAIKETEDTGGQNGLDYNQKLNYSCTPWAKDVSFFVPPATVTFVSMP